MPDVFDRLKEAFSDRYAIEREIGSGGMATVYLAEDLKHERKVAVKVLRPELSATLGSERFHREIKIAAKLHHPHILPLHDSGDADGFLYYVMPYEEGQSLREKLAKERELPIPEAVRILRDVVEALGHAHRHDVVHRDIKPDNVMLSDRHALVTDFGVAKAVSEATGRQQMTTEGVALGTPAYMAPEQAAADPLIDHRADIYAVGAVAYELLTGRPPFTGNTQQEVLAAHVTQTPDPVTRYRDSVPPALEQLVMKCLAKKAADRWQSADELLPQLGALATPSGGVTPTAAEPVAPKRTRPRWLLPVAVAAVVAVVVVGYFGFRFVQVGAPGTLIGENVLEEDDRILVVEFRNHTDDSTIAETITDIIRVDLQQSPVVDVMSQPEMFAGIRRMGLEPGRELSDSLARDLAERSNAKAYVTGDVRLLGSSFQITARLIATVDGSEALSGRVTADDETQLIQAVADLGTQLRRGIGESLRELRAAQQLPELTTTSLPALRTAVSGWREWSEGNTRRAAALMREAISLDSTFAMAWYSLGSIFHNAGVYREAREANEQAYRYRERLPEFERILATIAYHRSRLDFTAAEAGYRRLMDLDPSLGMWLNSLTELKLQTHRLQDAEELALQSIEHNPLSRVTYWNAIEVQVALGEFDAADSTLMLMANHEPLRPQVAGYGRYVLLARRDYQRIRSYIDSIQALGDPADSANLRFVDCLAARAEGRVAEWRRCGYTGTNAALWELRYTGDTAEVNRLLDLALSSDD